MAHKQVDIRRATYRLLARTPGHCTYGVWINAAKCGNLVVRREEEVGFNEMMRRGGFVEMVIPGKGGKLT
jgi:hypothetical protein